MERPHAARGASSADLVWIEDAADPKAYKGINVKGKIVFTSARPPFAKGLAARHGAVGLLSDFVTHRLDKPDCAFWTNAWSDDPSGWGLIEKDSRIFGFDISPRKGDWLRDLLSATAKCACGPRSTPASTRGRFPRRPPSFPARTAATKCSSSAMRSNRGRMTMPPDAP